MGTNFKIYPIGSDKVVYVAYRGAIRQAKYLGCYIDNRGHGICGGQGRTHCMFKVAGIEEEVGWEMRYPSASVKVYWSLQDAQEGVNPIEWKELTMERFNEIAPSFDTDKFGGLVAYKWIETRPERREFYQYHQWTAIISPELKVELLKDIKTREPLPVPSYAYKTEAECRANNRAEVVTF